MSRRELFGSLCAMVFLVNVARVVFAPLLPSIAADFGVTAASLGVVTSAVWLGSAAPRLPTGYLLTHTSRHRVVTATGSLLVVTATVTAFTSSLPQLTVGAFLMGLSSGMYFIAANPLVSELFPDRVGRALGIHGMSSQLASVTAPLAVVVLLWVTEWRTAFLCVAVLAAATTLVFVLAARRTELPEAGEGDRSLLEAIRSQWRIVLTGVAFLGAAGFLWNGLFNLYVDYLVVVKGVDPSTSQLLLSSLFVAGVPAFLLSGRLADRLPNVPMLIGISAGFVVAVLGLTYVRDVVAIAVTSFLVGYAFYSIPPALDTYLLSSLPDRQRASAYAFYSFAMMSVQALGSGSVGTAVTRGASYTTTFRAIALAVGALVVVLFLLYRSGRLPTGRGTTGDHTAGV